MERNQHSQSWGEVEQTQREIQAEWTAAERQERQTQAERRQLGLLWLLSRRQQCHSTRQANYSCSAAHGL